MQTKTQPTIIGDPVKVTGVLSAIALTLVLAHLAFLLLRVQAGHPHVFGIARVFNLNEEGNIPSFYSATLLLLCAFLFATIWILKREQAAPFTRHWGILAMVFLYLSIDEASELHELLSMNMKRIWDTGWLYYPWVIPATIAVVLFAILFTGFILHLPSKTRRLFILAAITYLGGAIGIELLGGRHHALYGDDNMTYSLLVALEESLELGGILVLVFALLEYMQSNAYQIRLSGPTKST